MENFVSIDYNYIISIKKLLVGIIKLIQKMYKKDSNVLSLTCLSCISSNVFWTKDTIHYITKSMKLLKKKDILCVKI